MIPGEIRADGPAHWKVSVTGDEDPGPGGIPPQLQNIDDLFDVILQLQPEGKNININALKGVVSTEAYPELQLDPATMLISPNPK